MSDIETLFLYITVQAFYRFGQAVNGFGKQRIAEFSTAGVRGFSVKHRHGIAPCFSVLVNFRRAIEFDPIRNRSLFQMRIELQPISWRLVWTGYIHQAFVQRFSNSASYVLFCGLVNGFGIGIEGIGECCIPTFWTKP
jgi:hypothetical protein